MTTVEIDTKAIDASVGIQLKSRRKELKLSQTQLGEILGITYQQIQKYESGANKVSPGRLVHLSKALGMSLSYFFEGVEGAVDTSKLKPHDSSKPMLLNPEKVNLLKAYDTLTPDFRKKVYEFITALSGKIHH
ncbi:MAG: transcriptional regulator with XRE-family HTH domain [Alphaproteobacteria bacterium]|jgi:transcriptional regulator with XRE-family HTH domain